MNYHKWHTTNEIAGLSNLLERSFRRHSYKGPNEEPKLALDIYETDENLVLRAVLPGAKKEDISVELEDKFLTITARVEAPELPEGAKSLLSESRSGDVKRTLKIAHNLDIENSKGTFVDGVLEVNFPKAPEAKRKSIVIE